MQQRSSRAFPVRDGDHERHGITMQGTRAIDDATQAVAR